MASPELLPSEVEDRDFISLPPEEDLIDSEGWEECGKWILSSADADLSFLDRTWQDLRPLLKEGTLRMLKSSTARLGSEAVVFQCFTAKGGKAEAKRAAEAIRKTIDFRGIMYYKMNKLTKAEIGRRFGHRQISTYMHTYKGRFYERNASGDWILEGSNDRDISIASRFLKENYSGSEELLSSSRERFLNLPRPTRGPSNWYLKCSLSETDDDYLVEADRVWIVAKELLAEKRVSGISGSKNARGAEIRFYFSSGSSSSISSQLDVCDRIRRDSSVGTVMYYVRRNGEKVKHTYKYTAEGELYEQTDFAEKFVLERD